MNIITITFQSFLKFFFVEKQILKNSQEITEITVEFCFYFFILGANLNIIQNPLVSNTELLLMAKHRHIYLSILYF